MKQKILIVDDETDFCLIMQRFFIEKGYEVSVAYTLNEGLKVLREFRPHILFLDNNLPDGEGWDSIDKIVETIPQIRAYLVSAHRNKSTLKPHGDNIVIWEKPISFSTLNAVF
ncbi:MAG: response regulator [Bacteroidota bacterium]